MTDDRQEDQLHYNFIKHFFSVSFSPVKTFLTWFVSFILWFSVLWWCFVFFHGNLFQVEKRWNVPHHICKNVLHGNMQPLSTRYSKTFIVFLDEFWLLLWCHVMPQCGVTTFMSRNATSSYFISCSMCLVSSCHVKSCFVMLRYSMSRHLKPFHVMLYMYVLIPVMSVHVICHLSHVKSGINTIFVIRTFVCALCWPVEFVKGYVSVK